MDGKLYRSGMRPLRNQEGTFELTEELRVAAIHTVHLNALSEEDERELLAMLGIGEE